MRSSGWSCLAVGSLANRVAAYPRQSVARQPPPATAQTPRLSLDNARLLYGGLTRGYRDVGNAHATDHQVSLLQHGGHQRLVTARGSPSWVAADWVPVAAS